MNEIEMAMCENIGLTESIISAIGISISMVKIPPNTVLFKPGDSCKAFVILCSGSIKVEMTAKSGREINLYRINPSECCLLTTSSLLNNEKYYARGVSESTINALTLSTNDFHKAIQHCNKFSCFVLFDYAKRIRSVIQLVDRMASRDTMADVAEYLCLHRSDENTIFITQNEIAINIGTAREVVGRKLKILVKNNIITLSRGKISINNINKLESYIV